MFEGVIEDIKYIRPTAQSARAQFVCQDGAQHRVFYHVVYEDGDHEDLTLSQVLPLLAQASGESAAGGQV